MTPAHIQIRQVLPNAAAAQQFMLEQHEQFPRQQYELQLSAIPYTDGRYYLCGCRLAEPKARQV